MATQPFLQAKPSATKLVYRTMATKLPTLMLPAQTQRPSHLAITERTQLKTPYDTTPFPSYQLNKDLLYAYTHTYRQDALNQSLKSDSDEDLGEDSKEI